MGAMRLIVWRSNIDKNWQKVKRFYKILKQITGKLQAN